MKWHTTTRPNGDKSGLVREQVPGLQAYVGWVAIIVTILGAVIVDRIQIEHRLDETSAMQLADRTMFVNQVKVAIHEADRSADFVTRREWYELHKALSEQVQENAARIERRLNRIESHSAHTLSVVEKLPGAKENPE